METLVDICANKYNQIFIRLILVIINLNLLERPHLVASLHTGGHPGEGEGAEVIASCFDRKLEDWSMNKTRAYTHLASICPEPGPAGLPP